MLENLYKPVSVVSWRSLKLVRLHFWGDPECYYVAILQTLLIKLNKTLIMIINQVEIINTLVRLERKSNLKSGISWKVYP